MSLLRRLGYELKYLVPISKIIKPRELSSIMVRGEGLQNGRGWQVKFFRVVLTWVLEVLTTLEGGTKGLHPLKGGGGRNKFQTRNFPIL